MIPPASNPCTRVQPCAALGTRSPHATGPDRVRRAPVTWQPFWGAAFLSVLALMVSCSSVEPPASPQEVVSLAEPATPAPVVQGQKLTERHPPPPGEADLEPGAAAEPVAPEPFTPEPVPPEPPSDVLALKSKAPEAPSQAPLAPSETPVPPREAQAAPSSEAPVPAREDQGALSQAPVPAREGQRAPSQAPEPPHEVQGAPTQAPEPPQKDQGAPSPASEPSHEAAAVPTETAMQPSAPVLPLPLLPAPALTDGELRTELARWVRTGGVAVSINGTPVFEYRAGTYVPASILKLATAAAALHVLGPDYRFRTEVYVDAQNNVYVRGYGEPYLVSEAWHTIARELERIGVFDLPLNRLFLDDTAFAPGQVPDGVENSLNPYDARLGALVTNFNTVNVRVIKRGKVVSAEPQTPLTPLAIELARSLPRGTHRINLSRRARNTLRYTAEVARAILQEHGARFAGPVLVRPVPPGLVPAYVYRSEQPLREVIQAMFEFSNNFIANQITLVMALEKHGPPARLADGVAITRDFLLHEVGLGPEAFSMVEGSGISRQNRVDLLAMLRITDAFYPWRDLLHIHEAGHARSVLAKTGTLSDVHSLAGYLPAPTGERRSFVIMLNQTAHNREQVLQALMDRFGADVPDTAWER